MTSNYSSANSGRHPGSGMMPVLFLGHGSPMNAIEDNSFTRGFSSVASGIRKPEAILCISAHWVTRGTYVTAMEKPRTIHDFSGFPRELYEVQYPAPGRPKLAEEIMKMVGRVQVMPDYQWGLDHGTWSVIKHMYPKADIPVVQLSLDMNLSSHDHYELAKELEVLREKEVLVLGSGNMVHNLSRVAWDKLNEDEYGYDWAIEANEKMKKFILEGDYQQLIDYPVQGETFRLAIPTPEHYLPLLYVLALKSGNEKIRVFNDKLVGGSLSMASVFIGG